MSSPSVTGRFVPGSPQAVRVQIEGSGPLAERILRSIEASPLYFDGQSGPGLRGRKLLVFDAPIDSVEAAVAAVGAIVGVPVEWEGAREPDDFDGSIFKDDFGN